MKAEADVARTEQQAPPERPASRDAAALGFALLARPWRTLALVGHPSGPRVWQLAQAIAELRGGNVPPLQAVNVTGASNDRVAAVSSAVAPGKLKDEKKRFVVAADSPLENPAVIGLVSTCDAVVLVVRRGETRIPDARRIVELLGPERVLGVVFDEG